MRIELEAQKTEQLNLPKGVRKGFLEEIIELRSKSCAVLRQVYKFELCISGNEIMQSQEGMREYEAVNKFNMLKSKREEGHNISKYAMGSHKLFGTWS